jgi:hypothetical protein
VQWEEWKQYNLLDYQGLLIDCRNPSRISGDKELSGLLAQYMQHGHTVFLILPDVTDIPPGGLDLSVIPYLTLNLQLQKGKTLNNIINSALFQSYIEALRGHEIVINARATVQNIPYDWLWQIAVSDNVKRAVCGQFGRAYVFHPPSPGRDSLAMKAILDFFGPDLEEPEPDPAPEWATNIIAAIPGVADIEARTENNTKEIARLQSAVVVDEARRTKLARWAEMLWLTGVPLQQRVSEALGLLGVPNKSENPTGHTHDLQGICQGRAVLFEVTASTGSIGVEKGRQLLQWIGECEDPTNTKGVLIGNAYRNDPPDKRPPSPDHRIFVKEVEDMAHRFHFALLDVRDLFRLVIRKIAGEEITPESVVKRCKRMVS